MLVLGIINYTLRHIRLVQRNKEMLTLFQNNHENASFNRVISKIQRQHVQIQEAWLTAMQGL